MNKSSELFLALFAALALLAFYEAFFPVSAALALTRFLALSAFLLLCVSLLIGPLALLRPQPFAQLIESRRAVGVAAFLFMAAHFLASFLFSLDGNPSFVFAQPPLLVAALAIVVYFAMALTSTNWAVRTMGFVNWKTLHRLTYPAFVLVLAHFLLKSNGLFVTAPGGKTFLNLAEVALLLLAAVTIVLQGWGFFEKRKRNAAQAAQAPAPSAEGSN